MPGRSQPLIILGASARAAAWSAWNAGFSPYSIDLFADRDTAEFGPAVRIEDYPGGFAAALEAAPQAPWIYTGSLENYPDLVDRLAEIRPLLGNAGSVLRRVRDPWQLSAALCEANFAYPETAAQCPAALDGDWLRKPLRSGGGMGIRLAVEGDNTDDSHYFQRFVAGQLCSAIFTAAGGRATYLGASRQLAGRDWGPKNPFLYVGSIAPLDMTGSDVATLSRLGQFLAEHFQLTGLFGVDFIRAGSELWVLEVNPRYTASVEVVERASGILALDRHPNRPWLATAPTTATHLAPTIATRYHGKAIVYAPQQITIPPHWGDLVRSLNEPSMLPAVADLPRAGDAIEHDKPICTLFAAADSPTELEDFLRQRTESLLKALSSA